jgi:hypothetical protein
MKMKVLVSAMVVTGIAGMANATQVQIVSNIAGTFTDISGTGTALNLGDDTSANITTTIGNTLLAAGQVTVNNNGGVAWGGTGTPSLAFTNASLLTGTAAFGSQRQALLPYWDDMDSELGNVYWQEIGGVLIVQWHNRPHFSGTSTSDTGTFQLKVFSGADGTTPWAQYIYQDLDFGSAALNDGASATIGYQDAIASDDAQWSFNTAGSATAGTVLSLVVPAPGALALLGVAGLLGSRRRRR